MCHGEPNYVHRMHLAAHVLIRVDVPYKSFFLLISQFAKCHVRRQSCWKALVFSNTQLQALIKADFSESLTPLHVASVHAYSDNILNSTVEPQVFCVQVVR